MAWPTSVNWLFVFLLLFSLYTTFMLFFYFWKGALSSFVLSPLARFLYSSVCALSSSCMLSFLLHPFFCVLSSVHFLLHTFLILRFFLPKLHPKLLVQQAPNTHLWLIPSHSGLLHVLPLYNELLHDNLSYVDY
jgi:hypothetical protein